MKEKEQVKAHSGEKHWEKLSVYAIKNIPCASKRDEMMPNP